MNELNVIEVGVILTFDTVVNDDGTQECFGVYLDVSDNVMETIDDMFEAIREYMLMKNLPHTKLWKISTSADWKGFEARTGLTGLADEIARSNGKWAFAHTEILTEREQQMRKDWGFGADINWTDETDLNTRIIEEMIARLEREEAA